MKSEFSAILSQIDLPDGVAFEDILRASEEAAERISPCAFDGETVLARMTNKLKAGLRERNRILGVA